MLWYRLKNVISFEHACFPSDCYTALRDTRSGEICFLKPVRFLLEGCDIEKIPFLNLKVHVLTFVRLLQMDHIVQTIDYKYSLLLWIHVVEIAFKGYNTSICAREDSLSAVLPLRMILIDAQLDYRLTLRAFIFLNVVEEKLAHA